MSNLSEVMQRLEKARSANILAGVQIIADCEEEYHCHAEQLFGAADMMQEWIESIRGE